MRRHLKSVIGALAACWSARPRSKAGRSSFPANCATPARLSRSSTDNLWRPGVELTARLIARILDRAESDPAARLQALLLISGVLAFQSGRNIALRTLGWPGIGPDELALVKAALDAQIDAI
ncbi:MAG: CerR family C-terminal domain-containing protein [Aliidongia sp.]